MDDAIVVPILVMFFVYILRCADGALYVGSTGNVERRVAKHQEGTACAFTRWRRPVALIYAEPCLSLQDALARERQIKRWTRAKKEALAAGDLAALKKL